MADLLNPDAVHHNLDRCEGWEGTTSGISKTYRFDDEAGATAFVEQVAGIANGMDHHPEVSRDGNDVALTLVTHSAGAVSYTHLRAHETDSYLVCRLLLEKKKN